jgi:hypothetical protein
MLCVIVVTGRHFKICILRVRQEPALVETPGGLTVAPSLTHTHGTRLKCLSVLSFEYYHTELQITQQKCLKKLLKGNQ